MMRKICLMLMLGAAVARGGVSDKIDAVLADKYLAKAEVGVVVMKLGDGPADASVVYQRNATTPRTPASNLKLVTTSAALDRLGCQFKFRTLLVQRGADLVLVGDGDPTLGDAELLKKSNWESTTVFRNWADILKKKNVTAVRNVIVDDSVFEETAFHPRWPANQYPRRYMAEVGGLNFNVNCVDVTVHPQGGVVGYIMDPPTRYTPVKNTCAVGTEQRVVLTRQPSDNQLILRGECSTKEQYSITIHDPALYTGQVLADVLSSNGVSVTGQLVRDRTMREEKSPRVIAILETPITAVLARANKDSMNLYAEALCKRLGYETTRKSGSWENGTAAVGSFLERVGVSKNEFTLDDGCGLSKNNAISPSGLTRVLAHNYYGPNRECFINTLSVAGVDGTLDDRFKGTTLKNRVFGKSGYVNGVSALSGYLKSKSGQWYAFSILFNHILEGSNSTMKPLQERIVKAVDDGVN